MDIKQLGNRMDMSKYIIHGGRDDTWFQVVHASDQVVDYTDYPSYLNGKELSYMDPAYWEHKAPRVRQSIRLTVSGNAVCCESALRDLGHDAHAIGPTTVMVVLP